jgi:mxaL protein
MSARRQALPLALALALLAAAFALPTLALPGRAHDTVVVFDITQSMEVQDHALDGAPAERLAFARRAARDALGTLPCGSRVGWAAFAEYRTVLLLAPIEVCAHYDDLLATLDGIDGRMRWGQASEVTKGAYWAVRVAQEAGRHDGGDAPPAVVFVTDGHEAPPLREAPALFDDLVPGAVRGWILGAGGVEARPIPKTDADGRRRGFWRPEDVVQPEGDGPRREHLSSLREPHLRRLAGRVGFDYARLTPATLAAAMTDPRFARQRPVPTDVRWVPAGLALALLVAVFRPARHRA